MPVVKQNPIIRHTWDDGSKYDMVIELDRDDEMVSLTHDLGDAPWIWIFPDTWPDIRAALDEHFAGKVPESSSRRQSQAVRCRKDGTIREALEDD